MQNISFKNSIMTFSFQSNYYINYTDVELLVCCGRMLYSEFPERQYILNLLQGLLYDNGVKWRNKFEVIPSEEDKRQAQKLFPELY